MKIKSRILAYIDENFGNNTHFMIFLNRLVKVETVWLKKNSPQGRFGGGWSTKMGILIGRSEFVIEFFVISFRVQKLHLSMPWRNKVYTKIADKVEYRRIMDASSREEE